MHNGHTWEPGEICWVCWCYPSLLAQNGAGVLSCQWHWRTQGSVVSWAGWTKGTARCGSSCVELLSPPSLLAHLLQIVTALWSLPGATMFPLKVGIAGEEMGKKVVVFFKSCPGFCLPGVFSPWGVPSLLFQAGFHLWEIPMKQSNDMRVCEMLLYFDPNHLGEKE